MKSLRDSETNLLVLVPRKMAARVRGSLKRQALRSERNTADEWLLWGAVPRASSPLLAWRAEELISRRNRMTLARCVRRTPERCLNWQSDSKRSSGPCHPLGSSWHNDCCVTVPGRSSIRIALMS